VHARGGRRARARLLRMLRWRPRAAPPYLAAAS
jgi:hypothetical protein